MSNIISMWYRNGLCNYLSDLGFNHFATGEAHRIDFDNGRAFMVNTKKKTFGLKDMVHSDQLEEANRLSDEFSESGKIEALEQLKDQ